MLPWIHLLRVIVPKIIKLASIYEDKGLVNLDQRPTWIVNRWVDFREKLRSLTIHLSFA